MGSKYGGCFGLTEENFIDMAHSLRRTREENAELRADIRGLVNEQKHVASLQKMNDNQAATINEFLDKACVCKVKLAEVILDLG